MRRRVKKLDTYFGVIESCYQHLSPESVARIDSELDRMVRRVVSEHEEDFDPDVARELRISSGIGGIQDLAKEVGISFDLALEYENGNKSPLEPEDGEVSEAQRYLRWYKMQGWNPGNV